MFKQLPSPEQPEHQKLPARYHYIDLPAPELHTEPEGPTLLDYWRTLLRYKGTVLLFALAGATLAILYSLAQTPIYQASTILEILPLNENFFNRQQLEPMGASSVYPEWDLRTQMRILQSESLAQRVLAKMEDRVPPEALQRPSRADVWRKALGLKQPEPEPEQSKAASLLVNLKASLIPETRLIEVRLDSTDPRFAAEALNTLTEEFIQQNLEARWQTSQQTGEWLTRQLQDLKIKLERAEEQLQSYARTAGLMFTGEKDNVAEQKLQQLQQELLKAQSDRAAKQARYEQARSAPPETLPEILEDDTLRTHTQKLIDLRRELAELRTTFTDSHPRVLKVQAQIAALEAPLERHRRNVLDRIRNEYEAAERREKLLLRDYEAQAKVVSQQAERAIQYNILKREVDTQRALYEAMLQRVKEYGIASAMQASNVRVVEKAKPPRFPYKPNYLINSAVGLMLGLMLGVGFVFIRERADRTIQTPGETSFYLDLPELGVIPCGHGRRALLGYHYSHRRPLSGPEGSPPSEKPSLALALAQRTSSLLTDSFRATLTSILFSAKNGHVPKVLVFTSPNPAEGKTTVVSNLGLALAEINRRVLLMDADLRKPRLHEIFEVPNDYGLAEYLLGQPAPNGEPGCIFQTRFPNVFVLPAGKASASAANLLYSPRLPELLAQLREQFDAILLDTPPMLAMPDARIVGRLSDGVILIIRSRTTTRDAAQAAAAKLREDGTPILGTILNDWDPKTGAGSYYGYRGDYYSGYRQYYHHYPGQP